MNINAPLAKGGSRPRRYLIRALMIVPPILFLAYTAQAIITIRGLMSESSSFHLDYANDLVQDYLALEMALELEKLRYCLAVGDEECPEVHWITLTANDEPPLARLEEQGKGYEVYLRASHLKVLLPGFFAAEKGLSGMFWSRSHEPVYWFQLLDAEGETIFQSGDRPEAAKNKAVYPLDRSLKGYQIEIIYNSFGAKQLYSVSRNKINFLAILLLFILAVFSAILITRSIRQKLLLARQKTYFVSTVSHEFKTPLAIMRLAAETLQAKRFKSPEEEGRFLSMLTNEINRLNHLVHKILSFNKIEMEHIHYNTQNFDLRDVLQTSAEVFQTRALAEGVALKVSIPEKPCLIHGDADLIRHAIDNVVDNAFKYRDQSKEIELLCERKDHEVAIIVRDSGIGIPEDELNHIFKSFYRINDPRVLGMRGSGLGLAISGSILRNSNARYHVDSRLGEGTTFHISFPLVESEPTDVSGRFATKDVTSAA